MFELRTLGQIALTGPPGADLDAILAQPKRLGLLIYLTTEGPHGFHRRDRLLALLWPELDAAHGRAALSQALYYLRRASKDGILATRGGDELGVTETHFWCDAVAFRRNVCTGRLQEALELYRGDFLDGFYVTGAAEFDRWLDKRRRELRTEATTAAWTLSDRALAEGDCESALAYVARGRTLAPYDEEGLRRHLKLLDALGQRADAVQEYEEFAHRLANDLELEPSPETAAVMDAVRARAGRTTPTASPLRETPPPARGPVLASSARRPRSHAAVGFALAALAVVGGLLWLVGRKTQPPPELDPTRVAVVAFAVDPSDSSVEAIGSEARGAVVRGLAATGLVNVVSQETIGAGIVLRGSVIERDDQVQLELQGRHAMTGATVGVIGPITVSRASTQEAIEEMRRRAMGLVAVLNRRRLEQSVRLQRNSGMRDRLRTIICPGAYSVKKSRSSAERRETWKNRQLLDITNVCATRSVRVTLSSPANWWSTSRPGMETKRSTTHAISQAWENSGQNAVLKKAGTICLQT